MILIPAGTGRRCVLQMDTAKVPGTGRHMQNIGAAV
jgi:hypothetical protein